MLFHCFNAFLSFQPMPGQIVPRGRSEKARLLVATDVPVKDSLGERGRTIPQLRSLPFKTFQQREQPTLKQLLLERLIPCLCSSSCFLSYPIVVIKVLSQCQCLTSFNKLAQFMHRPNQLHWEEWIPHTDLSRSLPRGLGELLTYCSTLRDPRNRNSLQSLLLLGRNRNRHKNEGSLHDFLLDLKRVACETKNPISICPVQRLCPSEGAVWLFSGLKLAREGRIYLRTEGPRPKQVRLGLGNPPNGKKDRLSMEGLKYRWAPRRSFSRMRLTFNLSC